MPLRDVSALYEWRRNANPPPSVWRLVRDWVGELGIKPWQWPSIPEPDFSDQPHYEVRSAEIPGTNVAVYYRHEYEPDVVDLVWVG